MKKILIFILMLIVVCSFATFTSAEIMNATQDTWTEQENPAVNHGNEIILHSNSRNADRNRYGYILFEKNGRGNVLDATLYYKTGALANNVAGIEVEHTYSNESFDETVLVWNTQVATFGGIWSSIFASKTQNTYIAATWYNFDITDVWNSAGDNFTILLNSTPDNFDAINRYIFVDTTESATNSPYVNFTLSGQNISFIVDYPTNTITYYGDYSGYVNLTISDYNGAVDADSCDINDPRWSIYNYTNTSFIWLNNTPINQNNISIFVNCTDDLNNTANRTFWFYQSTILDLYFYDEETNELLNGTRVYLDLVSGGFAGNYSTNVSMINFSFLNAGDYTINYYAIGYDVRNYYIAVIVGQRNSANLYLLNSSESALMIPTVYNQNSDLTANVTMKIQRYYVASNSYTTVSMTKTNEEGEGVLYAELYDVNYKIIFEYQKEIVLITDPYPFTSATPVYRINLIENAYESWVNYDNVITNVSFINATGTIYARFIYNDVTNNLREGCLKVTRHTTTGTSIICYNCTSSSAATLTCLIDDTIEGEYIAVGSFDTNTENSWYNVKTAFFNVLKGKYAFGEEGIFAAMIMIGTITLLGISTITGSFILLIVSFIFISVIGLIQGVTIGTAMYLVVMVFLLLFIIRKVMEQ